MMDAKKAAIVDAEVHVCVWACAFRTSGWEQFSNNPHIHVRVHT